LHLDGFELPYDVCGEAKYRGTQDGFWGLDWMESENTTITWKKPKYIAAIVIISIILMSVAAQFHFLVIIK